jgi:hypothetical protein
MFIQIFQEDVPVLFILHALNKSFKICSLKEQTIVLQQVNLQLVKHLNYHHGEKTFEFCVLFNNYRQCTTNIAL